MVTERFQDSVVIVTGSTRGIGERVAKRFASEGASVVVTGRTEDAGKAVVGDIESEGGEAVFVRADMRDPEDIAALIEATADRYGHIDVLVNNAGVQTETAVDEATQDDWAFVLETDFRAYWLAGKQAVSHMPPGSSIVNVSSNHAYSTMPEMFPYNAVKAGINGMTRAMALDFGPEIRANTVAPGWIEIARTRDEIQDDQFEHVESIHPLGRIGDPADVAGPVTFLASEDAAFITGTSLLVDGGRTAVMQDDTLPDYRERRSEMGNE
jgi:glucose 1-dehydrogenase